MVQRLCQLRNLSQVAQEFQLTQPALSKWLREFEDSIGAELFERHARGLTPRPIAMELARQAEGIVGRMDRARQIVDQMVGAATAQMSIGVTSMVAATFLPRLLRRFHPQHPGVSIHVAEGTLGDLLLRLRRGELDLVIGRREPGIRAPDLYYERLCHLYMCLVSAREHPLVALPEVGWDEAMSYPWVAPSRDSTVRQQLDLAFSRAGLPEPRVVVESAHLGTTVSLLQGTQLVAPMATMLATEVEAAAILNVNWQGLELEASMDMIWRNESVSFPMLNVLKDCAREISDTLSPSRC